MLIKNGDGTYSGDYIFKGEAQVTKESLEKALNRVRTLLSTNQLNGEICYVHNLNDRYKNNINKFFELPIMGSFIKIMAVEVIDDEDNIGLRVTFRPKLSGVLEEETKDQFYKWLDTNQMTLIPRMIGSKKDNTIVHFDIITFDLVPKEGTDIDLFDLTYQIKGGKNNG